MSFFEIFDPGYRHLREERERRKIMVAQPRHGGGAPLGIDLDGGTAKITIPRQRERGPSRAEDSAPEVDHDSAAGPA